MCGRYTLAVPDPATVRARFAVGESVEVRARYNVAPGDDVLSVTTDREGAPRGELLRWGLVPSWAKTPDTGLKMINARVETVAQRPAYRRSFERFRCLIIADGFYEWRRVPSRRREAFHITSEDRGLFAFAGLWSVWRADEHTMLRTCTILTTAANQAVAPLHGRMPVILAPESEAAWLDSRTSPSRLHQLLTGLDARHTVLRPVGPAVNDARYDGPDCLAAPPPSGQAALF
jgi:putative SOS response-associated peptidase YedK